MASLPLLSEPASSDNSAAIATTAFVKAQGYGTGTVISVGMTVPTGLSVSPASITTSGTFAITTGLSGLVKAASGGFVNATAGTDYVVPTGSITGTAGNVTGTVAIANGGHGQVTAAAGFNALSPLTTLGDVLYASAANTNSRLAGNTTSTKKFLTQTGTGTVSAAPAWTAIAAADVPVFVASGASHAAGAVPDPGSTAGSTKFLREDATWATPTGSGGMTIGNAVSGGTSSTLLYVDASGNLADVGLYYDATGNALGIGVANPQNFGNLAVGGTSSTFVNFSCTGTLGSGSLILMQFTNADGSLGYDFGISSTTSTDFGIRVLNNGTVLSPFHIDMSGNVSFGVASPATSATGGFVYLPAMAGAPTGVPGSKTGLAPVMIDSTNKKFWAYLGGTWVGTDLV